MRSPPAPLPENYGQLVPLKIRHPQLIRFCYDCPDADTHAFLAENFNYKIVGVRDKMLFKQLRGLDFVAGRNILYKQCRENPSDVCLMHNKAVLLAFDH